MNDIAQPPNTIPHIGKIWAFLSVDPVTGNEGVCASMTLELGVVPLIAADEVRLKTLTPIAQNIARLTGVDVVLVEFTTRRDLELYRGKR